ncbi:uncharacterized protein VP01_2298g2 [Puccinia sorghi]|uniref:Cytochrome b5 heme-binding domain-containing protein n=1 Tax=Puccinia sorghi TaxID=27349 RepID=A0A0L6V7W4_9BASI|nr:uncharacterized protein VP01_2298g2 [Puccinia sorghi]
MALEKSHVESNVDEIVRLSALRRGLMGRTKARPLSWRGWWESAKIRFAPLNWHHLFRDEYLQDFTFEELSKLSTPSNLHLVIRGKVYAVAKFLEEHPGGDEVLLTEAGKDATESFEDVGHSEEARTLMEQFCVGTCKQGAPKGPPITKKSNLQTHSSGSDQPSGGWGFMVPLAILAAYLSYREPL